MPTAEEIERARAMLAGPQPGVLTSIPQPVAPQPTVADEMARASLPQRAPTFTAMPSGPMSPDQAAAAGMLGINPPPSAMPTMAPPTADQIARAPAYTPEMGPIQGVIGAAPPPQQTAAGQAIAQARDALLARSGSKGPVDLTPRGTLPPNERSEGKAAAPVPGGASVEAARQALAGRGGGGGGASPISKLQSTVKADEQRILGTYATEKEAMDKASRAEQMQTDDAAQRMKGMANDVEARAAEEAGYQRDYEEQRNAFRAQTQQLTEEIRTSKIDPQRLYGAPKFGSAIAIAIGGAVAGMFQAMKGGDNQFVSAINRNIDLDIQAQQSAIDNKKSAVQARNTLYGQLVASHQDAALARLQTKNAMLEAAKMQLDAEAKRLGNPIAAANAERAINAVDRQQAEIQRSIDVAERDAAIRAQAAAAAARAAAEERNFRRGVELEKLRQDNRKLDIEEMKETGGGKPGERFVATGTDPKSGAPVGFMARNGEVAKNVTEQLAALTQQRELVQQAIAIRDKEGALGRTVDRGIAQSALEGVGNLAVPFGQQLGVGKALAPNLGTPEWRQKAGQIGEQLKVGFIKANQLGTLDKGTQEVGERVIGDLTSRDTFNDDATNRARAYQENLDRQIRTLQKAQAGTQVAKVVGPDGRETYVPIGQAEGPDNKRTVPRGEPVR